MPTRIVWAKSDPPPSPRQRRQFLLNTFNDEGSTTQQPPVIAAVAPVSSSSIHFRGSILKELSVRNDKEEDDDNINNINNNPHDEEFRRSNDIRASPRLVGYIFSMMAAAVMLVSTVQFYRERGDISVNDENEPFYQTLNGAVSRWKLWGAIYASSAGVALSLTTVLVHFDTVCAPKLWTKCFKDGSRIELVWILVLVIVWIAAVHICTSTLSVGENQANVFFTTWIAFGSTASNIGVWRESAGLSPFLFATHQQVRETTYNWVWTAIFSCVMAGAATDIYLNRYNIELRYQDEPVQLLDKDWNIILSVVWSEFGMCVLAIYLNEHCSNACKLPCRIRNNEDNAIYRCVCGWRQMEGLVILVASGCKFWVILNYASANSVISGLSNAYFGLWGSFFNGIFCLGTWIRENKNVDEFFVRENDPDENNIAVGPVRNQNRSSNSNDDNNAA